MSTRCLHRLTTSLIRGGRHTSCPWVISPNNRQLQLQSIRVANMSGRPSVFVTRRVPVAGRDLLLPSCEVDQWDKDDPIPRDELLKRVKGKDALFCLLTEKIDEELLLAAGPQLKVVATMSVGYDHVDLAACKKHDIKVGFTPGVLTHAVAELTIALLLTTSRRLREAMAAVVNGEWGTWKPMWLCGQGLEGSTVGIVGMGRIGLTVAKYLQPFAVEKFLYSDQYKNPGAAELGAEQVELDELLQRSDFVLACCALTPDTKEMFNKSIFDKMKKSAIFINTSRGGVVNQGDLYEALRTGEIGAAGLDVTTPEPLPTDSPLLTLSNCVVFPHIASATDKSRSAMSELTARNILAALNGEKMPTQVQS